MFPIAATLLDRWSFGLRVFLNFQRLFKYEVDTEILIYLVRLLPNIYKLIVDTYFGKRMYIPNKLPFMILKFSIFSPAYVHTNFNYDVNDE